MSKKKLAAIVVIVLIVLVVIDAGNNPESAQQLGESAGGLAETIGLFIDLLTEPFVLITIITIAVIVYAIKTIRKRKSTSNKPNG